jgi:hypothetical protein
MSAKLETEAQVTEHAMELFLEIYEADKCFDKTIERKACGDGESTSGDESVAGDEGEADGEAGGDSGQKKRKAGGEAAAGGEGKAGGEAAAGGEGTAGGNKRQRLTKAQKLTRMDVAIITLAASSYCHEVDMGWGYENFERGERFALWVLDAALKLKRTHKGLFNAKAIVAGFRNLGPP